MKVGDTFEASMKEMRALVSSGILGITVQGMGLTADAASGSVPELIEVVASSGIELKVVHLNDEWKLEVVKVVCDIVVSNNLKRFKAAVMWDGTEEGKVSARREAYAQAEAADLTHGMFVVSENWD